MTELPCKTEIDMDEGECCLLNCPDKAINSITDRKERAWAVADCKHWKDRTLFPIKEGILVSCITCDKGCGGVRDDMQKADALAAKLIRKCPETGIVFENVWSADGGNTWKPRAVTP